MKKHGEDKPAKHVPTMKGLEKLANDHPDADLDTKYQDNTGKNNDTKTARTDSKTNQSKTK